MYGAILGDSIGSPFEFDRGDKTKKFEFFTRGCGLTDDSVMTIAVAEALIAVGPDADEKEIEDAVVANMQDWGRRYPNAGYGGKFWHWLRDNKPKPYGSYGNGSAMRVSAAGWLYPTIERTREVARWTAAVTHNHPEGIKGAEATAGCIFLARSGASKEDIRDYVEQEFHYDLSRTLDEIRPYYHHVESCQQTVPEAITAFLEAEDFEDAVRNAVSLGGDTDTLAAITGSIAEAFFGIPAVLKAECRNRLFMAFFLISKNIQPFYSILCCHGIHAKPYFLVQRQSISFLQGADIKILKHFSAYCYKRHPSLSIVHYAKTYCCDHIYKALMSLIFIKITYGIFYQIITT